MAAGTSLEKRAAAPVPAALSTPQKIEYAKMLADSGLLPAAYRKQPANLLYAIEYGQMLGLSPMAAITQIHVIEGKPTASSALIAGLVRRAGHKLEVSGDDATATARLTRGDDGSVFEVTWTLARAKTAELSGKGNWKKYPAAMLKARAITEACRDGASDVLFGVIYTPEELGADVDEEGTPLQMGEAPRVDEQPKTISRKDGALFYADAEKHGLDEPKVAELAHKVSGGRTDRLLELREEELLVAYDLLEAPEDAEVVDAEIVEETPPESEAEAPCESTEAVIPDEESTEPEPDAEPVAEMTVKQRRDLFEIAKQYGTESAVTLYVNLWKDKHDGAGITATERKHALAIAKGELAFNPATGEIVEK